MVISTAEGDSGAGASAGGADPGSDLHQAMGRLLASRYANCRRPAGDSSDLESAISHARQGLAASRGALGRATPASRIPDGETTDGETTDGRMTDGRTTDGRTTDGGTPDVIAGLRTVLGLALADRFEARTRQDSDDDVASDAARSDRDEAITELSAVLPGVDAASWPGVAITLGRLRHQRFSDRPLWAPPDPGGPQRTGHSQGSGQAPGPGDPPGVREAQGSGDAGEPGDLDAAVRLLTRAAAAPAGDLAGPDPQAVRSLVAALWDKYTLSASPADRDALISWAQVMLDLPRLHGDDAASGHDLLGLVLLDRARDSPQTRRADLTAAIGHLEAALAALAPADPGRPSLLALLAGACWRRIDGQASSAEVDQMTGYAGEAWRLRPAGEPIRAELALYLAVGLHESLRRRGAGAAAPSAASSAASTAIEALAMAEPQLAAEPDSHALAIVLLGHFLISRAESARSPADQAADLAAARPWILRAAGEVPAEDPQWSDIAQTLAGSMSVITLTGLPADQLNRVISFLAAAARRPAPQPERAALIRTALGAALVQRAELTGSEPDLVDAIAHLRASWNMTPENEIARIAVATRLGSALLTRFTQGGDRQDVEAAQYFLYAARDLAGAHADLRPLLADADATLSSMRGLLGLVRGLNGDTAAVDQSVVSLRAAMAMLPPEHPQRARVRNDLGLALTMRALHGSPPPAPPARARAGRAHLQAARERDRGR